MKLEQLIVQYLYNNKKVTIQDIGNFSISPDVVLPSENEKEAVLPAGAISFEFDQHAPQDDSLIEFIMQQTRKIRPLAASDLESYSILSKQFLNLGKPLMIEGLGTLLKTQLGHYEFTQGQTVNARLESAPARAVEKDREEISFRSPEKRTARNKSKKTWFIVLALFFVALAGASLFYLLYKNNKKIPESIVAVTDTMATPPVTVAVPDTGKKAVVADTIKPVAPIAADSTTFRVSMRYRSKEIAQKAFTYLTGFGHKLSLAPLDSVRYKISMAFRSPVSDTAHARDSVSKMFGAKTFIDLP